MKNASIIQRKIICDASTKTEVKKEGTNKFERVSHILVNLPRPDNKYRLVYQKMKR